MKKIFMQDRDILSIAIPSIVSNITIPLLGLIDLSIVGHLGNTAAIGAIAVGSMAFNVIYWVFGFLRMGTSGLTAQAFGGNNKQETQLLLSRSVILGLGIGVLLIVLQVPLLHITLWAMPTEQATGELVESYYRICIWGAPAMLCLYGLNGWFIGMQNSRIPMFVSIFQNVVNIFASLGLVYGLDMDIQGVALGTLTAQYAGMLCSMVCLFRIYGIRPQDMPIKKIWNTMALKRFANVNRDIFLRTLSLVAVNLYFVSVGARLGTETLAANALLMQFFTLFSYVMDGFAYAGEALCGKFKGAADGKLLQSTVARLFKWGAIMIVIYTSVYISSGQLCLQCLTNDEKVLQTAFTYVGWAYAIPTVGAAAFIWDGVFVGTTESHKMLQSAALAATCFFVIEYCSEKAWGNHGLWIAFLCYLTARSVIQTWMYLKMRSRL